MNDSNYQFSDLAPLFDEFYLIREAAENRPKENKKNRNPLNFLGGFQSRILFIVNSSPEINNTDAKMLDDLITKALKSDMNKYAIVNLAKNPEYTLPEVLETLAPLKTVIWGCEEAVSAWGGLKQKYEVSSNAGNSITQVDAVDVFHQDIELKKKLWEHIRPMLQA